MVAGLNRLYVFAAAVARQVYVRQGLGIGQLRVKYGGRNKRKGVHPEHFKKGSGGMIRHILKQFEQIGYVEKHTGRLSVQRHGDSAALPRARWLACCSVKYPPTEPLVADSYGVVKGDKSSSSITVPLLMQMYTL